MRLNEQSLRFIEFYDPEKKELILSGKDLGDLGIQGLAKTLPNWPIVKLDLSGNALTMEGVKNLVSTLPYSEISDLSLEGNKIGNKGADLLLKVLPQTKICNLNLKNCGISDDKLSSINSIIMRKIFDSLVEQTVPLAESKEEVDSSNHLKRTKKSAVIDSLFSSRSTIDITLFDEKIILDVIRNRKVDQLDFSNIFSSVRDEKISIKNNKIVSKQGIINFLLALDDGRVISVSESKIIQIWDLGKGISEDIESDHVEDVRAISVWKEFLASGSEDGTIKIWNLKGSTSNPEKVFSAEKVHVLKFNSDGKLASGCSLELLGGHDEGIAGCISIWDPSASHFDGLLVEKFDLLGDEGCRGVCSLLWLSTKRLAIGCFDGTIKIWDLVKKKCELNIMYQMHWHGFGNILWRMSDDLLMSSSGGILNFLNLNDGSRKGSLQLASRSVAMLPNAQFAVGGLKGSIDVWDIETGKKQILLTPEKKTVSALEVLNDRLIGAYDNKIYYWDLSPKRLLLIQLKPIFLALRQAKQEVSLLNLQNILLEDKDVPLLIDLLKPLLRKLRILDVRNTALSKEGFKKLRKQLEEVFLKDLNDSIFNLTIYPEDSNPKIFSPSVLRPIFSRSPTGSLGDRTSNAPTTATKKTLSTNKSQEKDMSTKFPDKKDSSINETANKEMILKRSLEELGLDDEEKINISYFVGSNALNKESVEIKSSAEKKKTENNTSRISRSLLERLEKNDPSLKELDLSEKQITDEDILILSQSLMRNSSLTSLALRENQIGVKGAQAISNMLTTNVTLTILDLLGNQVGDEGAIALAGPLSKKKSLKALYLSKNQISAEGTRVLAKAIRKNSSLIKFDLGWNPIGDLGASALGEALSENNSLKMLHLGKAQISDQGVIVLSRALSKNALTRLDLIENEIGDKGIQALSDALSRNSSLKKLHTEKNRFSDVGKATLAAIEKKLQQNRSRSKEVIITPSPALNLDINDSSVGVGNNEAMKQLKKNNPILEKKTELNGDRNDQEEESGKDFNEYLALANKKNHAYLQYHIAGCYYSGKDVKQSYENAFIWYKKAALQNYAFAQNALGDCYFRGEGTTVDHKEALVWYQRAALHGIDSAKKNAKYLSEKLSPSNTVQLPPLLIQQVVKKVNEKKKESDFTQVQGSTDLSANHEIKKKVSEDKKEFSLKDHSDSINDSPEAKHFKEKLKLAIEKNADAQNYVGYCYSVGKGVLKDEKEAVSWYKRAAELGNVNAQVCLGICLKNGVGITPDLNAAVEWFQKAADVGYAYGQGNLAICYEKGIGVTQSDELAIEWLQKAVANGNVDAQQRLDPF